MRTLLIVDDQEIFRRPISEALRMKGFRVLEASDSVSAMAHAQLEKPDLALIDIRMPEVNGLDLIRMMQARASTARIPVILVTAQAHREDIATGSALGIRDFLLKSSFSVGELVERIETRIATASAIPPAPPPPPASLQLPGRTDRLAPRSSSTSTYASEAPISSEDASTSGGPSARQKLLPPAEVRALPAPIAEILAIASSQTASLSQVQAIVRRDPILAERVMTAASGVGIKGTAEIESLEGALRVMGIENLVRLVASTPVLSMEELNGRNGQELVQIWSHGLATAVIAERIAPSHERLPSFLQGLFHVIPALIGVQSVGAAWPEVAARARREGFNGIDALALTFGQPT